MWGNNEGSSWNPNASYPPPVAGNVDWAALAQQWIAMKGQGSFDLPPVAVPPPPPLHHLPSTSFPPPSICAPPPMSGQQPSHLGEANMDLDEEEEEEEEEEEILLKTAPEPSPKSSMTNRHRKQSSVEDPSTLISHKIMNQKSSHSPTIDANARKKLPPWIREGLEKMEKEKQKKEQMEKRQREREEVMRRIREEEEVQDMKYTKKGRTCMDEENHPEAETEEDEERKTTLDDPGSPSNGYPNKTISKSKEELLEEMTITLRRTLTEILLEVTSSEIQNVCVEILDKYRRRQSGIAVKGSHQKALGQLLSGYASDEDRQSSDGSSVENESRLGSSSYSDEENLESIIRRKKREFEKTSEKINSICAAKEENFSLREKRWIDEGELNEEEGVNLAHIYGRGALSNSSKDIDNSEEASTTSPVRSSGSRRNRSKERKSRENSRRSVSSDRGSRSKERSSHRSKERYSHDRRSPSRERRSSYDKSSIDRRSVSRERNTSHVESSARKHKSKSSKHGRESRERSRDIKMHRRHSRDDKRKRRKRSRHSSSSSSSPSPIRSSSSKKSRRRKRSRS